MIADVVVNKPIEHSFQYLIPQDLKYKVKIGQIVIVPFRNETIFGYVVGLRKGDEAKLKSIIDVVSDEVFLNNEMLKLSKWMADYYYASWGECISTMLPASVKKHVRPKKPYQITEDFSYKAPKKLNNAQKEAIDKIKQSIQKKKNDIFLLYGVTASGKTEVYIKTIEIALKEGKGAIVLVPEIALTPQTLSRFYKRFGSLVSVLHSRLTAGQRYWEWMRIKKGEAKIVIGARSAIFAPFEKIGLIVIDEEHETTYKQKETPRYHAREVAIKRAEIASCPLLLGSATPSLESFYNAEIGKYILLQLPKRVKKREMPQIEIIDMRNEKRYKSPAIFSQKLKMELENILKENKQGILFLNRRGFSTYVYCPKCGWVMKCPKCEVSLTYHSQEKKLICHYCNYSEKAILICPNCNKNYLSYRGIGTQKVESQLHKLFPTIKTERLDSDAIRKKGELEEIIEKFRKKEIDVVIGTQLVAKGHDFPEVNLVGVISADTSLNIINFRADEKTFALLTQVAGRTGRGEEKGKVIIQTYSPQHYTIRHAVNYDYKSFYNEEIKKRAELRFPPFSHLIKILARSKKEQKLIKAITELKKEIINLSNEACDILGPAPHPLVKLKKFYRWQLIIKGKNVEYILRLLYNILGYKRKFMGCEISIDVDPYEN